MRVVCVCVCMYVCVCVRVCVWDPYTDKKDYFRHLKDTLSVVQIFDNTTWKVK